MFGVHTCWSGIANGAVWARGIELCHTVQLEIAPPLSHGASILARLHACHHVCETLLDFRSNRRGILLLRRILGLVFTRLRLGRHFLLVLIFIFTLDELAMHVDLN